MNLPKQVAPYSLYIHIPKCGGTSIISWLSQEKKIGMKHLYSEKSISENKEVVNGGHITFGHININSILSRFPQFCFDSGATYIFATVRNPFERFLSLYHYLRACSVIGEWGLLKFLEEIKSSARDPGLLNTFYLSQTLPQSHWLECRGVSSIHLIGQLEKLDDFIEVIQHRYSINSRPEKLNTSPQFPIPKFEDDVTSSKFEVEFLDYYARDFEILGYKKEISSKQISKHMSRQPRSSR